MITRLLISLGLLLGLAPVANGQTAIGANHRIGWNHNGLITDFYAIAVDGGPYSEVPGGNTVRVAPIPPVDPGDHTVRLRACNTTGCSAPATILVRRVVTPDPPTNVRVSTEPLPPMPFSNGYDFRRTITVDNTKVAGGSNHTNFPVLVSGTYAYLKTVANGGKVESASGFDIRFELGDGTQLDHEVERWVDSTGEIVMWVRIPTLDFDDDTEFYLYYGNAAVSATEENVAGVWDANYKSVVHMHNASGPATDSKAGNNGTASGSVTFGAAGKIGAGVDFATGNNYLSFGDLTILDGVGQMSVEFLTKLDSLGTSRRFLGKWGSDPQRSWLVSLDDTDSDELILATAGPGSTLDVFKTTDANLTTSTWYHIAITWLASGGGWTVQVNGVSKTLNEVFENGVAAILNSTALQKFGAQDDGNAIDGILDEVRLSDLKRSTDWFLTEYNNQSDPATFYAVGGEETSGGGSGGVGSVLGSPVFRSRIFRN